MTSVALLHAEPLQKGSAPKSRPLLTEEAKAFLTKLPPLTSVFIPHNLNEEKTSNIPDTQKILFIMTVFFPSDIAIKKNLPLQRILT